MPLTETAANKINALLWRIAQQEDDDPTLMRHLYDLSALKPHVANEKLAALTHEIYEVDKKRAKIAESFEATRSKVLNELSSNNKYICG